MRQITVFHAGSIGRALQTVVREWEERQPGWRIALEGSGARQAARKIFAEHRRCDVFISADESIVDQLLRPDYARFNIRFAGNRLVLKCGERSRYRDELTPDNWFEVLLRPDVTYGHTDPELDPAGYRAKLCWQLAERYYRRPGLYRQLDAKVRPEWILTERAVIQTRLFQGELDYFFGYASGAGQHGRDYLQLPAAIDFSLPEWADYYRQATLELSGVDPGTTMTVTGRPIVYSVTIPENAPEPEAAADLVAYLLENGEETLRRAGITPLPPTLSDDRDRETLPGALRRFIST